MKKTLIFWLSLVTCIGYSQENALDEMEEKLVQKALVYYPSVKISENKEKTEKIKINLSRTAWADDFIAQYNLNQANLDPNSTNGINVFFPKYLFGVRLSLYDFFKIPMNTKIAKVEYQTSVKQTELEKIELTSEVKKRFRVYIAKKENLSLQKQLCDQALSQLNIVTKKYNNKEIPYDEYFKATTTYISLKEALNSSEAEMYVAKYSLEELVGSDVNLI